MNTYTIRILTVKSVEEIPAKEITVKSECAMWTYLRKVRDGLTDKDLKLRTQAIVTDSDGNQFKNIIFTRNSKGKIEMPNSIKTTCRRQVEKAKKAAAEAAAKAEAKKAKKREADRRYRAKKKAEKEAAMEALNKRAEAEGRKGTFGEIEIAPTDLKVQTA